MTDAPTVLVAHADADRLLLCRASLEHDGYRVVSATTADEVRGQLAEALPDALLLDVELAAPDGWSLLGALTTDEPARQVPVVLLVGEDAARAPGRGWAAGATEVLSGPLGPLTLSRVVRDVLDTSSQERRHRRELVEEARRGLLPGPGDTHGPVR